MDIRQFVLGKKSVFTLVNTENGNRKTYFVKRSDDGNVFFVHVRGSADGIDFERKNWLYIGCIFTDNYNFGRTSGSKVGVKTKSFQGFNWLWNKKLRHNLPLPDGIEIHHEGRCGACGRRLTDPESIKKGFGPDCYKRIGG